MLVRKHGQSLVAYHDPMKCLGASLLFLTCSAAWTQVPDAAATVSTVLTRARIFTPEQGRLRTMTNGGKSRDIVHGALVTGEVVDIHESIQAPGLKANSPHTIQHSEFILVREGTLAFEHDGQTEEAGPGDIIYVAYGTLHSVRNTGKKPATYVVIAIGGDEKK